MLYKPFFLNICMPAHFLLQYQWYQQIWSVTPGKHPPFCLSFVLFCFVLQSHKKKMQHFLLAFPNLSNEQSGCNEGIVDVENTETWMVPWGYDAVKHWQSCLNFHDHQMENDTFSHVSDVWRISPTRLTYNLQLSPEIDQTHVLTHAYLIGLDKRQFAHGICLDRSVA